MKRVLIFGCGVTGRLIYNKIKDSVDVIAWLDNDETKWGQSCLGLPISGNVPPDEKEYDEIIIGSLPGLHPMKEYLISIGVPQEKICTRFLEMYVEAREYFLKDYSTLFCFNDDKYAVAEGGVLQGDFARVINECFPTRKLFLFDTFEGFNERDIEIEKQKGYSDQTVGHLNISSEELVLSKMPFPDKVEIRKGVFPDTTVGLEDERFVFVNLDFDLYQPTFEGLKFFYPKMAKDSIILIHDFFNNNGGYTGVQKAVEDFEEFIGTRLIKFPIGDHYSLAIYKE